MQTALVSRNVGPARRYKKVVVACIYPVLFHSAYYSINLSPTEVSYIPFVDLGLQLSIEMKSSSYAALIAAISTVQANPVSKRAVTDADILNYALTLEHLEATFYAQGLQSQADFVNAGYADPFYSNLLKVASDEKEHVSFLTSALQGTLNAI